MRENIYSGRKLTDRTLFCQIKDHETYYILSLQSNTLNTTVHCGQNIKPRRRGKIDNKE